MRWRRVAARLLFGPAAPAAVRRQSSFPFVSGDTFRAVCDSVIEYEEDLGRLRLASLASPLTFCSVDMLPALLTSVDDATAARMRLVVHNGDALPAEMLAQHAPRFARVFAVNWLGARDLVEPLPIGLENMWIGVNGVWPLFADCVPAARSSLLDRPRERQVLLAFNDHTCPDVRTAARAAFLRSALDVDAPEFLTPTDYHARLRNTLFVPSPRGNGVDCHRTWEAIYAGAVPIVVRRDWAFDHLGLPVLVADDWQQAVDMISSDPRSLYEDVVAASPEHAYALPHLLSLGKRDGI